MEVFQAAPGVGMYEVTSRAGEVIAYSVSPLPFEPQGWKKEFRRDLSKAIRKLAATEDEILHSEFSGPLARGTDIENLLLYNVGIASFRNCGRRGLRFMWISHPSEMEGFPYRYRYRSAMRESDANVLASREVLASARADFAPKDLRSIHRVWIAILRGEMQSSSFLKPNEAFAIEVVVRSPDAASLSAIGMCKSLLDAAISAFHWHSGEDLSVVSSRLSVALGIPRSTVEGLLMATENRALGLRRLVWPRSAGVQWNPADDRCIAGEILIEEAPDREVHVRLSRIYE